MNRLWWLHILFVAFCLLSLLHFAGVVEPDTSVLAQGTIPREYFLPIMEVNPIRIRTSRISVASDGTEANDNSFGPTISSDGRFVAFYSEASNLVEDDTNDSSDIFVHDRQTGETTRISVGIGGSQASSGSWSPAISENGLFVAFTSAADDLVDGDTNDTDDVFVHDRETGETTLVSVSSDGIQANLPSGYASLSEDGRFVAFYSMATNLVSDDTNQGYDVFVHDRERGETERVSISSDGEQGTGDSWLPSISADGHSVVFTSNAPNLVSNDTNEDWDDFVHDRQTGETSRVSIYSDGTEANRGTLAPPSISSNGRFFAFSLLSSNLVDVPRPYGWIQAYLHDLYTGETTLISVATDGTVGNLDSYHTSISAQGDRIAFMSYANNLISYDQNGRPDIFVHDRLQGKTKLVTLSTNNTLSNNSSSDPVIAAEGGYIAYHSRASNLVPNDTNSASDIFVYDMTE